MISLPVWLPGPVFLQGDLCAWSMFEESNVAQFITARKRSLSGGGGVGGALSRGRTILKYVLFCSLIVYYFRLMYVLFCALIV